MSLYLTQNLYNTAKSVPNTYTISNDWRKRYIQVANFFSFQSTAKGITNKLTEQEIKGILNKKQKTLKKWKTKNRTQKLTVFSADLKTALYQFFPKNGVLSMPFEMIIYKTESKIEHKIAKKYPQFMDWNIQIIGDQFKEYFKMKEETLNGLSDNDYEDVMLYFHSQNWFGTKKTVPHVWYDLRSLNIKVLEIGPVIYLEGYVHFWIDLFLETYLPDSVLETKNTFGGKEFIIRPYKILPLFLRYNTGNMIQEWIAKRIIYLFKNHQHPLSKMFKTVLMSEKKIKKSSRLKMNITSNPIGLKDYSIVFSLFKSTFLSSEDLVFD